jgi:hypothetical protein
VFVADAAMPERSAATASRAQDVTGTTVVPMPDHERSDYPDTYTDRINELIEAKKKQEEFQFPYGDIAKVHRCELLAAEVRAGRLKYRGIEDAAIRLRDMIDEMAR